MSCTSYSHALAALAAPVPHQVVEGHVLKVLGCEGCLLGQRLHHVGLLEGPLDVALVRRGDQESRVGHSGGFHVIPVLVGDMVILQVSLQRLVIDELESISYSEGQTCS